MVQNSAQSQIRLDAIQIEDTVGLTPRIRSSQRLRGQQPVEGVFVVERQPTATDHVPNRWSPKIVILPAWRWLPKSSEYRRPVAFPEVTLIAISHGVAAESASVAEGSRQRLRTCAGQDLRSPQKQRRDVCIEQKSIDWAAGQMAEPTCIEHVNLTQPRSKFFIGS